MAKGLTTKSNGGLESLTKTKAVAVETAEVITLQNIKDAETTADTLTLAEKFKKQEAKKQSDWQKNINDSKDNVAEAGEIAFKASKKLLSALGKNIKIDDQPFDTDNTSGEPGDTSGHLTKAQIAEFVAKAEAICLEHKADGLTKEDLCQKIGLPESKLQTIKKKAKIKCVGKTVNARYFPK